MWGPHTMSQHGFWGEHWTSEGVKTFFSFFFGLHLMFGENWSWEGVKTFFFGLHPMFGGKLNVGALEDDFGGVGTHCLVSALITL